MRKATLYAVLGFYLVVTLYPMVWMVFTGMKTERQAMAHVWGPPAPPTLANLREAWRRGAFRRAYLNSIVVSVTAGALSVAASALAGYALARLRFAGRRVLFYVFLLGMMIPVHVTLVPVLRLLSALHLRGTYWAVVGPYVGFALPLSIFVLRGFFEQVPRELEEAARVDGCSTLRVFWHVALPAARPALATVVIFNFVTMWNEFIFALTFIRDNKLCSTLPLALNQFSEGAEGGRVISQTCAAMTISVLPLLVVFFFAQKHIIRGLTAGALKG